ncbi:hypothetical protein EST38_g7614 [Candolleomyces aberdarensis]|uniref:Uncharacterized protein n=1 Tax=Candolleomyces aberdarensis TaxID=2316362 RepID=A0A4Q2DGN3_9AGAR|nr:hypothetical protein EST38_g7614 [Candolleomyces aberdarensis]
MKRGHPVLVLREQRDKKSEMKQHPSVWFQFGVKRYYGMGQDVCGRYKATQRKGKELLDA